MTPSEILRQAADYIDEHGLSKANRGTGPGDAVCPIMAMGIIAPERFADAAGLLRMRIGPITAWVAQKGVTKKTVVRTMRRVARELESKDG